MAKEGHGGHAAASPADPTPAAAPAAAPKGAQVVQVTVTEDGFVPAAIKVRRGQPVTLQVTRKTDQTCATEIVMKDFGVNQKLPLGKTVSVTITPKGPGAFRYACGMDMIAGVLTVD
jgi:plastocyanin domain-containing protein